MPLVCCINAPPTALDVVAKMECAPWPKTLVTKLLGAPALRDRNAPNAGREPSRPAGIDKERNKDAMVSAFLDLNA